MGVDVAVDVGVGLGEWVGVGVGAAVGEGISVGFGVGVAIGSGVGDGGEVTVGLGRGVGVGEGLVSSSPQATSTHRPNAKMKDHEATIRMRRGYQPWGTESVILCLLNPHHAREMGRSRFTGAFMVQNSTRTTR